MTAPSPPYALDIGPDGGIRGFMVNIEKLIGIRFAINPNTIEHEKIPTYEFQEITGFPAPFIHWRSGGPYKIKFELFVDRTNSSVDNGLITFLLPLMGAQGVEAILKEFMTPQDSLGFEFPLDNPFSDEPPVKRYYPPPDCYLILGLRWYRTKLLQAPIREVRFDKLYNPVRFFTDLEFFVIEEGTLFELNKTVGQAYGLLETAQGVAETIIDVATAVF